MLPTALRSISPKSLYEEYVKGKQTLSELAERHGLLVSTVQRRMRQVHTTRIVSKYKEVVILMDATYWGKSFGVLMIVDAYRKRLLWRKFLDKKETIADYLEGIEWLREHKYKILGIVCDGLWGLLTNKPISPNRPNYFIMNKKYKEFNRTPYIFLFQS